MVADKNTSPWWSAARHTDIKPFLAARSAVTRTVRAWFDEQGFTEVETAILQVSPGNETHLHAPRTELIASDGGRATRYLRTSPEFACKKLLAAGETRIFEFARVFRDRERGRLHLPEFTMLEWYRPGTGFGDLIDETQAFLRAVLPPAVTCRGITTSLEDFEILTVPQAFARYAGADVLATAGDAGALARSAGARLRPGEAWEDLFFRLLLERIEPNLGRDHPTFLTRWPAAQAALARRDPADPRVALRFELYVCGLELANAFEELTDPSEQRTRFAADRARRHAMNGHEDWPMDEDFLAALDHGMPAASGIALGFDRLAMIASGASKIDQVLWLPGTGPPP